MRTMVLVYLPTKLGNWAICWVNVGQYSSTFLSIWELAAHDRRMQNAANPCRIHPAILRKLPYA